MNGGQLQLAIGLCAFTLYLFFLTVERVLLRTARHRLRLVIHVNGTRGKSTVTRMVHSILLEAGYRAWGKTTGTEPRLLLPDGGERLIRRLGPANVREQRNMLLAAVRGGSDALVFECNAVRPELQLVSSAFLDPDLLVITNARLDHGVEQGDADSAALSFAATIPAGKALASSDTVHRALWEAEAVKKTARFIFVDPLEGEGLGDLAENVACAFAVSDWLGLPRDRAARAVRCYKPDPGVFSLLRWTGIGGRRVWFADALAANDPQSSDRLAQRALISAERDGMDSAPSHTIRILLAALRKDRPERTRLFVDYALARCRSGAGPTEIGSGITQAAWTETVATAKTGTATTTGVGGGLVKESGSTAHRFFVFDQVVFIGYVPRSERVRLLKAGVRYEMMGSPFEKSLAMLESQVNSTCGNVFIFAAGNRGGYGRAIHDWAVEKAEAWVNADPEAQDSGKNHYTSRGGQS
ncbi:MAG: Mur ligase family protein [Spirochaetota bacterium]